MPEFIADTSGTVIPPAKAAKQWPWAQLGVSPPPWTWGHLDEFTQGYIEALLFTWPSEDEGPTPAFGDLAPETLERILVDCADFQRENKRLLQDAYERDYSEAQAGHDLWFTRNGHGVGYWSRKELEPDSAAYEQLTAIMVDNVTHGPVWNAALRLRTTLEDVSLGSRLSAAATALGTLDGQRGDDDGHVYLS